MLADMHNESSIARAFVVEFARSSPRAPRPSIDRLRASRHLRGHRRDDVLEDAASRFTSAPRGTWARGASTSMPASISELTASGNRQPVSALGLSRPRSWAYGAMIFLGKRAAWVPVATHQIPTNFADLGLKPLGIVPVGADRWTQIGSSARAKLYASSSIQNRV